MMKKFFHAALVSLSLMAVLPSAPARAEDSHVKISIIPEYNKVVAGDTLWVLIQQDIESGWHTYWTNPGDSGAAPRVKWTLPEGFEAGEMQWPAPHRITLEGLTSYGYENKVSLGQTINIPDTLPDGPITLEADIEILVCKDICIPEMSHHTITLNDKSVEAIDNEDAVSAFVNTLPLHTEWRGTYSVDGDDFVMHITAPMGVDLATANPDSFTFLPIEWGVVKNGAPTRVEITPPINITLRQARDDRDLKDVTAVPAVVTYKNNDESDQARSIILKPDTAAATTSPQKNDASFDKGFLGAILFAILGGLILNLMPCVFPVLSIKALSLIRLREKGWGASAASGLAYTAGILTCFAAIGGVLLGIKLAGGDIGWGFQLQNPAIVLGLAYLLFIIGLNLSGLFDINGSFTGIGSSLVGKSGLTGTFFTGVLATLVATPCTAPFMAGALGYAMVQPPAIAMAVFLALGLGLALPYLLLALFPVLTGFLPRPGLWMLKFREALAFPVYASAAWLVWVLAMQAGPSGLLWAMTGLVSLAFGLWLLIHRPENKAGRVAIILIALVAFAFAILPLANKALLAKPVATETTAQAFTPDGLETLLKGADPVFVYMTASWCITCKVNERVAINTDTVQALFRDKKIAVLEGDWTSMNPDITKFLKSYGRSGVPLYVFYAAPDSTGTRPDPVVLPQILTPGLMIKIIGE